MIDVASAIYILMLVAVPLAWLLPRSIAFDGVALWTVLVLASMAPVAAAWLLATTLLTPVVLRLGERSDARNAVAAAWAIVLLAGFVAARTFSGAVWIGVAFFTLRHLHVVGDWWMRQLEIPRLRDYLRYQFFLPVIVTGPINRFQNFKRQTERRRWDWPAFLEGAERVLVGAFMAVVIGGWIVARADAGLDRAMLGEPVFLRDWAGSAMRWIVLYFQFAGFTAMALGTALMMGLRLEENFDRPWRATSLLDFWRRWHMTLSSWVQDYVFQPVAAVTRNPLLGLVAAMLAIGLWHEFSAYYVLWSLWQVLGIVLTRYAASYLRDAGPHRLVRQVVMPVSVLVWLSLSRPVVEHFLELFGMTPLTRLFARVLPRPLAVMALALAYAGMMGAILIAGDVETVDIIYIDVLGDRR